jgi:hypothetical protein
MTGLGDIARLRLLPLLAFTACSGLDPYGHPGDTADADADADADSDADADADSDSDADADPLTIDSVSPEWGSNGGGTQVTVTGGPFDDSARIYFTGSATREGEVGIVSQNQLTATVPSSTDVGAVDVKVVTDTRTGTATSAFQYWADGTGKFGVLGGVEWFHYVGSYWSGTPTDFGDAFLFFTQPTTESYRTLFYSPSLDTCVSNYAGASADAIDLGVTDVKLTIPTGGTLTLVQDTTSTWLYALDDTNADGYRDDLRANQYSQNGTYGLRPISASGFPSFILDDLAVTPSGSFQVTSPAIGGSTVPTFGSNIHFTWTGATNQTGQTPGVYMVAALQRLNPAGDRVVEAVTCAFHDTGDFTVPGSTWSAYPSGVQITVLVGRISETGGTLPYNDADSGVVGSYWVIGAGYTQ